MTEAAQILRLRDKCMAAQPIGSAEPHPRPADQGRQSGSPGASPFAEDARREALPAVKPRKELSAAQLDWCRNEWPVFKDMEAKARRAREETARMKAIAQEAGR